MTQGIVYHGDIEIQCYKKGIKTHSFYTNNGTEELFKTLIFFLVYGTKNPLPTPKYLGLYKKSKTGAIATLLNNNVDIVNAYLYENNIHKAVIEASVSFSNIRDFDASESDVNYYISLIGSDNIEMAQSEIPASTIDAIQPGTEGRVRWAMYFTNN